LFLRGKDEPGPAPIAPESRPAPSSATDPAALASIQRERDAARALREASSFEKEAIASGKPDLAAIRERYRRVAEDFADTPDGRDAASHVAKLTTRIEEAAALAESERQAAESRAQAAADTAAQALVEAEGLAGSDRMSEALQTLRRARERVAGTEHQAALDARIAETLRRADERAGEVLAQAGRLEAEGGDFEKVLSEAAAAFAASPTGPDAAVEPAATRLRDALAAARQRRDVRVESDRRHDAVLVDRTRKDVHRALTGAFDPESALAAIDSARAGLRLEDSKAQLEGERAMVQAMARVRDRTVASIGADDGVRSAKVRLPGSPDRRKLVDHTIVRADAKGLTVRRGAAESAVPFASLSAIEAWDCLFADVVEKDPALRADAIEFLLFAGVPERALALVDALPDGDAKTALRARAQRERDAWAALAEVRDLAARAGSDDGALARLYRAVSRLVESFRDTRAYLLNRRPPAGDACASRPAGS
jgi:hypothetical protein